jgi:hypothetical protein
MARARNIKPGFFKNEDLAECSPWARLCFVGLWTLADREGRLEDRPKRIKAELFAFDSIEVEPLLDELAGRGFIMRYRAEGRTVILIPTFLKHQNPHHREQPSELPSPPSPGPEVVGIDPKPRASASMAPKPEALPLLHGGQAVLNPSSLNPESLFSESMPTGAQAPAAQLTEGQVWQAGIELLGRSSMAEAQARAFLGKLTKDHGKQAVQEAVGAAVAEQPVDPRAYLRKVCAGRNKPSAKAMAGASSVRALGLQNKDYDHEHL